MIDRNHAQLSAGGAVFDLSPALQSVYGDMAGYDLRTARGLLEYVIDFVNRLLPRITAEQVQTGNPPAIRPQEQLRQLLLIAVHGPSAPTDPHLSNPSEEFLNDIRRRSSRIEWVHQLERTETGACWRHHASIPDPDSLFAFVATLLMEGDLRADLGQCRYRGCENFFLSKQRKLYCDDTCMKDANTQDSANRKNRERARNVLVKNGYSSERSHEAVEQAFQEQPNVKAKQLAVNAEAILKKMKAIP